MFRRRESGSDSDKLMIREIRSTILIFAAVLVFEAFWIPAIILNILAEIDYNDLLTNDMAAWVKQLVGLCCIFNPILYSLQIPENKSRFFGWLECFRRIRCDNHTSQATTTTSSNPAPNSST